MLRSDGVFSILFVHILLVKKILRLLFDSYIKNSSDTVKLLFLYPSIKNTPLGPGEIQYSLINKTAGKSRSSGLWHHVV
jgi:hypothetical protein